MSITPPREGSMDLLPPLETLFDAARGDELPLPAELASLYGPLCFPTWRGRPHVIGNFVSTLDGVKRAGSHLFLRYSFSPEE